MSIFDSYGAPQFGLRDCKIATWSATGSYGSAVDVPSVQLMSVDYQTVNAQLEGDDAITATHATAISAQVQLRFGSINFAAYEVLTGVSSIGSYTSPNRDLLSLGTINFPYIGVIGKANAVEGSGDFAVFIPKVKVMEGFSVSMEYGNFAIPEITLMGVVDGGWNIVNFIRNASATTLTLPPTLS